jgi:predicted nucleotidyltransferase
MSEDDLAWVLDAVRAGTDIRGDCTYIGGSIARGWANVSSDIDVYVLGTDHDAAENVMVEGRPRVDVHAVSAVTVDRLYAGLSWDVVRSHQDYAGARLDREWLLFERLEHAHLLDGREALAGYLQRLEASAYRHMLVQEHFNKADALLEDCLGQLAVNDDDSAVLSGQLGHLESIDGLLAARGHGAWLIKWRARAMKDARPDDLVTYEQFWRLATLADLTALGARAWAHGQVVAARELMARVDVAEFHR